MKRTLAWRLLRTSAIVALSSFVGRLMLDALFPDRPLHGLPALCLELLGLMFLGALITCTIAVIITWWANGWSFVHKPVRLTSAARSIVQPIDDDGHARTRRPRVRLGAPINGVSPVRRHIEEIRDLLNRLVPCSESLYQYGNPDDALNLLADLTLNDQKRLLCLGLIEGKKEYIGNAVRQMLLKLDPSYTTVGRVLASLPEEDRNEIEKSRFRMLHGELTDEPKPVLPLTETDRQRITRELRDVARDIGGLPYEDAVWILVPKNAETEATWIEAVGGGGEDPLLSEVRLSHRVFYNPSSEARYQLLTEFRRALWVLHVHNHPAEPNKGATAIPEASSQDREFSVSWKYMRPELAEKIKFFIVMGLNIVEYSLEGNLTHQWSPL